MYHLSLQHGLFANFNGKFLVEWTIVWIYSKFQQNNANLSGRVNLIQNIENRFKILTQ